MKSSIILFSTLLILSFSNCKTKQKSVETTPAPPTPLPTTSLKNAEELQIQIAQSRWPNTIAEELTEGKTIYRTKCTKCHENFPIEGFSEKKWLHEIDDMSPKANLSDVEKLRLTKFILSFRETKQKLNAN